MQLSENAKGIFKKLYSFQNENIEDTFRRVSEEFGEADEIETAFKLLNENVWRPNTPTFLNAGTDHKIFSACYVVGLEDSMDDIYDVLNVSRRIFQAGAGIGIPIGNLRESEAYIFEGDKEKPPEGRSSGPLSFMKLYDASGETTKSGGRHRRAAILCAMPVWHPDIMKFIICKQVDTRLRNMNISVLITDKFMRALDDGTTFDLITPYDGTVTGEAEPGKVWDKIAESSYLAGDPGIIFIDTVNKYNPLIKDTIINCTNPCGEQPLIPDGCCNLSAINLLSFIVGDEYSFETLYDTSYVIMGLMDNIIDKMDFPDERFKKTTMNYRPVGVGIMGLADTLFKLNLQYDSPEGRKFAAKCMKTITTACVEKSADLARDKGKFHNYKRYKDDIERIVYEHIGGDEEQEVMEKVREYGLRNIQFTTAQPTGTTALSCDASYGIEPAMGLVFQKNMVSGEKLIIVNPVFQEYEMSSWYTQVLIEKIALNGGSLKGIHGIPREIRETFVVAHDIGYRARIEMQAELQKYCSTAISSTVNLPKETTKSEISDLYKYAYERGLKGITIYRDGSKANQPVSFKKETNGKFKRPSRLNSGTFKIETGTGKIYVTVTDDDGKPVEVFLNLGKSGQLLNSLTEALGRVMSLAFQNQVPLEMIIKTLDGIEGAGSGTWHRFEETDQKPTQILSIPDGIAKLLNRYYLKCDNIPLNGSGQVCPDCGLQLIAAEGCMSCSCGYSKCS